MRRAPPVLFQRRFGFHACAAFVIYFFTGIGNSAQVLGFSRDYLSSLGVLPPTVRTQPKQSSDYCQTQEVPLVQQL